MSREIEIAGIHIPQSDWKATPESVKAVVTVLSERLGYIEEQLKQNSQNSSRPPSSDSLASSGNSKGKKKKKSKPKPKPRNSSSGEKKTERLYPLEACKEVHSHVPENCQHCGEELRGKDQQPYRHQIIEIPPLSAYVIEHQLCWAHLKRDLTAISQRPGISQEIGKALLRREARLFRWWHRVRDGTMTREQFQEAVESLRAGFKADLEAAAALPIGKKEKSPLAKTVRTAGQLFKLEKALWTFVYVQGVEPTNNLAEQALRTAVIWRRTSFGSQSQGGSEFVARILTVVSSLKAQERNPLDYLTKACRAKRLGLWPPSLLPLTLMDIESPMVA